MRHVLALAFLSVASTVAGADIAVAAEDPGISTHQADLRQPVYGVGARLGVHLKLGKRAGGTGAASEPSIRLRAGPVARTTAASGVGETRTDFTNAVGLFVAPRAGGITFAGTPMTAGTDTPEPPLRTALPADHNGAQNRRAGEVHSVSTIAPAFELTAAIDPFPAVEAMPKDETERDETERNEAEREAAEWDDEDEWDEEIGWDD
ncbi:MAG: hypothetical protein AAF205_04655 [Pseudomonadota bacterium]